MIEGGLIRGRRIIVGLVRIDKGSSIRSGRGVSSRYSSFSSSLSASKELVWIDGREASCSMIRGRECVVCANACIGSNDTSDEIDSGGNAVGERYGISKGANLEMSGMCMVSP